MKKGRRLPHKTTQTKKIVRKRRTLAKQDHENKEDGEEVVGLNIDTDFIDEKSSAIHALG